MTVYALISLLCAATGAAAAFFLPQYRKACLVLAGAFLIVAVALFAADCAVSCVRTGELYVPKR